MTQYGHFKYPVMLFELFNIPASLQKYINRILAEKLNIFVIIYLNNILIYIKNPSQLHINNVKWILDLLWKNSFFANLKKYQFHKNKVRFLELVILAQKI